MRRSPFVLAAAVVASSGWWVGTTAGADPTTLAAAMIVAWVAQSAVYWRLAGKLTAGANAAGAWILGIAIRLAALMSMWVLYEQLVVGRVVALTFGLTLVALVILEAIWLAASAAQIRS
ncbi:MAG: hypothetical protein OEM96_00565 [Gemmatimonadota bacterium]|nr:hypothetical protein [Gemmatimonadota bacterium]